MTKSPGKRTGDFLFMQRYWKFVLGVIVYISLIAVASVERFADACILNRPAGYAYAHPEEK
ncbi:hypothetical protein [Parapedobacter lycopersici]|uniref:hypothetical protein n=1 Tax=Parapedobacter lycopersici TaxID=1864939 RepID=UPI0033420DBA